MSVRRKIKVFLGGTCEGCYPESEWNNEELDFSKDWRKKLVSMLDLNVVEYFNPVVDDWNDEAQQKEIEYRKNCDICLYAITNEIKGVYSIAEIIDDSNKRPDKTIFCNLYGNIDDINVQMIKSLDATAEMVIRNNGLVMRDLKNVAIYINNLERPLIYKEKVNKKRLDMIEKIKKGKAVQQKCKSNGKCSCKSKTKKSIFGLYKYKASIPSMKGYYSLVVNVLGNDMDSTLKLLNTTEDLNINREIFNPEFILIEFREIKEKSDIIEPIIIDHKIEQI